MTGLSQRQFAGLEMAARNPAIKQNDKGSWSVPSQAGSKRPYTVSIAAGAESCTCQDFVINCEPCKHIYAARYVAERQGNPKKKLPLLSAVEVQKKPTYPQDWPAYNAAQQNEKHDFQVMLRDLCSELEEPRSNRRGRKRTALSDSIFGAVLKVYSTISCRRNATDVAEAQSKGFIGHNPHYNVILDFFDSEVTYDVLHDLVLRSSAPLAALENTVAVDSSGFSSSKFVRWEHEKRKKQRKEHGWVKAHVICGAKTNVIAGAIVGDKDSGDSTQLNKLLHQASKTFVWIDTLCADTAYSGKKNLTLLEDLEIKAYIPFRRNAVEGAGKKPTAWDRLFRQFSCHREEFLEVYHRRSNVESTFSMIKRKFGDSVRSRKEVAMRNEVLCKFICHNICCVIHTMYEHRLDPANWQTAPFVPTEGPGITDPVWNRV